MTEVHRVYNEIIALRELIKSTESMSDISNFDVVAKKTLLLSAASYFEKWVCEAIIDGCKAGGSPALSLQFIQKQALDRKYHTLFNWKENNLNSFLGLFGDSFKKETALKIANDNMSDAMSCFLYINSERNKLVHQNFASYSIDIVLEDIWSKFQQAEKFLLWLKVHLEEKMKAN